MFMNIIRIGNIIAVVVWLVDLFLLIKTSPYDFWFTAFAVVMTLNYIQYLLIDIKESL